MFTCYKLLLVFVELICKSDLFVFVRVTNLNDTSFLARAICSAHVQTQLSKLGPESSVSLSVVDADFENFPQKN